jgi:hypothetical protein
MEKCTHGNVAPTAVIGRLHDSQAGTGRHRCPVCSYSEGLQIGKLGQSLPTSGVEECQCGTSAPSSILSKLPVNQGGAGRHKCVNCAFRAGFLDGSGERDSRSSSETESLTHGVGIDEFIPDEEGRMTYRQHAVYERSHRNRARAIQIHGEKCLACGFCFNSVYGVEHAGSYIEIHHVRSITEQEGLEVDPGTDLVPLCSNCHSMAHRKTGIILSVTELKELLNRGGGSAS